jgi:DNA-binding NtrC family response regulator
MVTGYQAGETLKRIIQLGAYDCIQKPFQLDEVKKAIEKVISIQTADSPI